MVFSRNNHERVADAVYVLYFLCVLHRHHRLYVTTVCAVEMYPSSLTLSLTTGQLSFLSFSIRSSVGLVWLFRIRVTEIPNAVTGQSDLAGEPLAVPSSGFTPSHASCGCFNLKSWFR